MAAAPYATLLQLKVALSLAGSDNDTELTEIILQVSEWFDTFVNNSFTQRSVTEFYDGGPNLHNGIPLDHKPSEDATDRGNITVLENTVALTIDTDFKLDDHPARVLYRTTGTAGDFQGARWMRGERNIEVTYLTAYKVVPKDVERACIDESVRAWLARATKATGEGRIGLDSRDSGGVAGSQSFTIDDLSPGTQRMLRDYRQKFAVL